ncbi:iron complex transport system permease protein [Thermosporothrix hazakensis]|jgi:iron complex transport system permease protein|uniref:Iron complex transport system permease protein n=2 Tax=Thermosporothrix TaxID=768650 RepID=A0A326U9C2_THEHA|nr:iron ABC transporter permease [Thermosporothrix hazakensis]PZW32017.1 iron complex transport system permease protein [Thermosporothrix hazakensis]BBH91510.1 siderophore ABC transporter permease [Thermosporothrix sp. COM3]GCE49655.1 siderophore ABC transporter permease [Thermosporothrix hazakensis]
MAYSKGLTTIQNGPFRKQPLPGLLLGVLLLALAAFTSLAIGSANIDLSTVLHALFAFSGTPDQYTIRDIRVPRTLIAICVGASLAVAGALMQAVTRNPLASPGTMGVNAGASFLVVAVAFFMGGTSLQIYSGFSLLGAAGAGLLVYFLSSLGRKGMTPIKLVVAGATISTLFSSLSQGFLTIRESALDEVRFWLAGAVAGRNMSLFLQALPYMAVGLLISLIISKQVTILSLGDDVARGLGIRVGAIKLVAAATIVLLAGGAVSIAGPIGFVGLVIPHIVRALVGTEYRWIIPYSMIYGALLLLLSDIVARIIFHPGEAPVGAITALVGAPVLIWLVRQQNARKGKENA